MELGFNVCYLLDVVSAINSDNIRLSFSDPNSSILLEEQHDAADDDESQRHRASQYVVMPMRL